MIYIAKKAASAPAATTLTMDALRGAAAPAAPGAGGVVVEGVGEGVATTPPPAPAIAEAQGLLTGVVVSLVVRFSAIA